MKKVIIVGGGIAGLSAGIHAQMDGFETEIYESHIIPGGMCTAWTRNGYKIDNCVHWFSCAKPGMQLYTQWKNVGLVGDDVPKVVHDRFYTSELNGQTLTLWSDFERTRKEMIELSPEDTDAINDFIDTAKLETGMQLPTFKPITAVGLFDLPKMLKTMGPMIKAIKHIGKGDISDYITRFKHPLIRLLLSDFVPNTQYGTSFIASYATIASGNGAFPLGGSEQMIKNMVNRYESLGGKIHCKCAVESVKTEAVSRKKTLVKSVTLKDGTELTADYFIFATDPHVTFNKFLDYSYMPKDLQHRYENKEGNPIFTGFHCAFAVDGIFEGAEGCYFYETEPFQCANKTINRMNVKTYHEYGPDFAPEGKDIIQTHLKMDDIGWDYWHNLREKDIQAYKAEKEKVAKKVQESIENHFPQYKGKLTLLDIWTPATYTRFTGAYKGAYMTFVKTEKSGANYIQNKIDGIPNAFIASNWLMSPGGLPCALAQGYYASWYLKKAAKKNK